jgi:hypothetical protein
MPDPEQSELIERTNRAGVEFLFTDVEMAFTFLRVGETSTSRETRDRNLANALQGYRAVLHFLPRVVLSPVQEIDLQEKLHNLKSRLEQAGIFCES